jgi:hypothetical protein
MSHYDPATKSRDEEDQDAAYKRSSRQEIHEHSKRDDTGRTAAGTRQQRPKSYQAPTMMMMMIRDDRNDGESFPVDAP